LRWDQNLLRRDICMKGLSRRTLLALAGAGIGMALGGGRVFAAQQVVEVARSPSCNCCGAWIDHMRTEGFVVRERPSAIGLAVPGMPVGSPGMETGGTPDAYDVLIFGAEGARSFARY
jgi:hypothetical protein